MHLSSLRLTHNKLPLISLNLITKKIAVKIFDPRISSVEGQCANRDCAMDPSVIAVIFKCTLIYSSMLL